ncbi:hypothetical protein [Paraburkholderia sp. SIMBA_054]|uniref:hypothetical protein n=1 Tax=Paraburkholderia TaxID=1822464 RepID=UPI0039782D2A
METLQFVGGVNTPLVQVRRAVVFVVNSLSSPKEMWDKSGSPPGTMQILVKAAGVPIDQYSYESTELRRDIHAKCRTIRLIRESPALAAVQDETVVSASRTPDTTIYTIDESFAKLADKEEKPLDTCPGNTARLRYTRGRVRLIGNVGWPETSYLAENDDPASAVLPAGGSR